jgi:pimeloyl-ACP methyl ester carboxylesterase
MIHGAWLSARSWENYGEYFGNRGFAVSAPEWQRKQGDVEELRETAEASAGLGVQEIVEYYAQLIRDLDQPPQLIGHSYGGLFVELLLDRGLGRAGVAMSPAPPKGILALPFSTLKAAAPALAHPSKWHGVVTLTPQEFTYAFVNTFAADEAAAAHGRYAVPETGQIFYEAGFANFHLHPPTEVQFKNEDRAPLLIVGASEDHTVPVSLAKAQYKRYERSPAQTEYLEFEGRPHLHMVAPRLAGGRGRDRQLARRCARRADRYESASLVEEKTMDLHLTDKIAVVTGPNKGIGLAIPRRWRPRARSWSRDRSTENLDGADCVKAVPVNLLGEDGPALLVQRAIEEHGRLDVLVNNVGAVRIRSMDSWPRATRSSSGRSR